MPTRAPTCTPQQVIRRAESLQAPENTRTRPSDMTSGSLTDEGVVTHDQRSLTRLHGRCWAAASYRMHGPRGSTEIRSVTMPVLPGLFRFEDADDAPLRSTNTVAHPVQVCTE